MISNKSFYVWQVQYSVYIMVIWKEREHEMIYFQGVCDPATVEALLNCGMLKYFRVPGMKAYICLLEYIIDMWDPE